MLEKLAMIGFVPVKNLEAAEQFYCGALGLVRCGQDGFALVLGAAGGGMIRCVLMPDAEPRPFTILGWEVADIRAGVAGLRRAGVTPIVYPHFNQDADGVWTAPGGSRVAWFHDPDGNVLSLSEHVQAGGTEG